MEPWGASKFATHTKDKVVDLFTWHRMSVHRMVCTHSSYVLCLITHLAVKVTCGHPSDSHFHRDCYATLKSRYLNRRRFVQEIKPQHFLFSSRARRQLHVTTMATTPWQAGRPLWSQVYLQYTSIIHQLQHTIYHCFNWLSEAAAYCVQPLLI